MPEERIELSWEKSFEPVNGLEAGTRHLISIRREIIPIFFVPGIMGTRLRRRAKNATVWDPDARWFMFKNYGGFWVDAKERQQLVLGPERVYKEGDVEPYENDAEFNEMIARECPGVGPERGWGGQYWGSYRPLLVGLHEAVWPSAISRCFDLPVYACGYDWRGSAETAGKRLAARVRETIARLDTGKSRCRQVILVTHSMGGLVARSACKQGLEKEVLGVVHAMQPATGAAAAYWRMKAGFERKKRIDPIAMTLGTDGREVTSLLAKIPGGLQLLPSKAHRANDGHPGWLRFTGADGKERRYPEKSPYKEIYREERGDWRLILWKEYIAAQKKGQAGKKDLEAAWISFLSQLAVAETFHDALGEYQHPLSHHIYGVRGRTVDVVDLKVQKRLRRSAPFPGANKTPARSYEVSSSERGEFKVFFGPELQRGLFTDQLCLEMGPPEGDGDTTVARSSGRYLARESGKTRRFSSAERDYEQTGTAVDKTGHDSVFNDSPKALTTVLSAVEALCRYKLGLRTQTIL